MSGIDTKLIRVFLTTYNRPETLKESILSVLAQTVPVASITVLDNGFFVETKKILSAIKGHHIKHIDTRSLGIRGNLRMAQQMADREYIILLHDDDLLHPEYLEKSLCVLKKNPGVNLLTCHTQPWLLGSAPVVLPSIEPQGHLFNQKDYATFVYNAGHPSFSLAIYRSDAFKKLSIDCIFGRFGKWGDVPLMINTIGKGKAAYIDSACGWMGLHEGQDSNDTNNRPTSKSWLERELYFKELLGDNPRSLSGLSFCIMNYRHLRSGYKRRVRQDVSFVEYLDQARSCGALAPRGERFRFISPRIVQKIFEKSLRYKYKKSLDKLF